MQKTAFFFLGLIFFFLVLVVIAQPFQGKVQRPYGPLHDELTLKYIERAPTLKMDAMKRPLIILLHGRSSNEEYLMRHPNDMPPEAQLVAPRAPYGMGNVAYQWYSVTNGAEVTIPNMVQEEESRKKLIQFIKEVQKKYNTDATHTYLMGFSQGGILSLSAGLSDPKLIRGIVVLSGRLLEEVKPFIAPEKQLKHLHVFIGTGAYDKRIPPKYVRQTKIFLDSLSINTSYHEYPNGHDIDFNEIKDWKTWFKEEAKSW